jgi:DNA polymerase III delta prime subunit
VVENSTATSAKTAEGDIVLESNVQPKTKSNAKSRKQKQHGVKAQGQKTLAEVLNPSVAGVLPLQQPENEYHEQHVALDGHEADGRHKRRRTNSYNPKDNDTNESLTQSGAPYEGPTQPADLAPRSSSPHVNIPPAVPVESESAYVAGNIAMQPPATPPKKMMKLNAGGKLSSPGRKEKGEGANGNGEPRRRGRPRKVKEPEPQKTLRVTFRYASEDLDRRISVGQLLQRVLDGEERIPEHAPAQKKVKPTRMINQRKTAHPFFNGKVDDKLAPKQHSPRKASASTPGKLRSQALQDRIPDSSREAPYTIGSALLRDRLMVKHPGAQEPPWPDKLQAHVRGLDDDSRPSPAPYTTGKQKRRQIRHPVDPTDSILDSFSAHLHPEHEPEQRSDGYAGPRDDLRLPNKLLISGSEVISRLTSELKSAVQDPKGDELMGSPSSQVIVHPSVLKLCYALPGHLSAFDHCTGETQSWTQKYAPTTASEVLQPSNKMAILKDWLQSLKVNTVEAASATQNTLKVPSKPKKKRRRQVDEFDDFLVHDESELHEMDELPETIELDEQMGRSQPKSIVQASNGSKVSNAVLISGPHGCGKTASAYAVAKELGYQIFEISSAERRSGRDVLDRVGDMTENHIVRHHGVDPGELSASEDHSHIEAAFQKDLDSGRQGKMSAFFKKQLNTKPAPKVQSLKTRTIEKLQEALKQPTKDQQQSLILLEDVDVLFKEDKEFWTTVFKLLATSKRPFILTCNDEDLVPWHAMTLHAILRLAPPSADLVVDLMLLIAALEGHLLKRQAVRSLFESKDHDLRASIAELDFWCQMGVGDPKSGLSWIYQRYPPGSDEDNQGRKLRLISEGTLQDGMGLIRSGKKVDEDDVSLAWREFGIHPTAVMGWDDAPPRIIQRELLNTLPLSLRDFARMADSLSAMDRYTTSINMDASLPETPAKLRTHYIEGMTLLESNEKIDHYHMSAQLAISSTFLTYGAFTPTGVVDQALEPSSLLRCIRNSANRDDFELTRRGFACFDAISVTTTNAANGLEQSVFDGPLQPIATDLAPYVRSIAQYDLSLEEQRARLGEIVGEGHKTKRARTTRAARSALEGSQRGNTRRERWFTKDLDMDAVLATGGKDWPKTVADIRGETREGSEAPASSMSSMASAPLEQKST